MFRAIEADVQAVNSYKDLQDNEVVEYEIQPLQFTDFVEGGTPSGHSTDPGELHDKLIADGYERYCGFYRLKQ